MLRDFYGELKCCEFKPMRYSLYNKLDDNGYIIQLKNQYNEVFSIDDFEYYQFHLSDEEKFFLKMKGKKMSQSINNLLEKLSFNNKIKVDIDRENGTLCVIKIKNTDI